MNTKTIEKAIVEEEALENLMIEEVEVTEAAVIEAEEEDTTVIVTIEAEEEASEEDLIETDQEVINY